MGCLIYEMMVGSPPFTARDQKTLYKRILSAKVSAAPPAQTHGPFSSAHTTNTQLSIPAYLSGEASSLLRGLLERNVERRLGSGKSTMFETKGSAAIRQHPFFTGMDWRAVENGLVQPPVAVHAPDGELDTSYFAEEFTRQDARAMSFVADVEPNRRGRRRRRQGRVRRCRPETASLPYVLSPSPFPSLCDS